MADVEKGKRNAESILPIRLIALECSAANSRSLPFAIRYSFNVKKGWATGTRTSQTHTHARSNQILTEKTFQFEFSKLHNDDGWIERRGSQKNKKKMNRRPIDVSFAYAEKWNTTDVAHSHVRLFGCHRAGSIENIFLFFFRVWFYSAVHFACNETNRTSAIPVVWISAVHICI